MSTAATWRATAGQGRLSGAARYWSLVRELSVTNFKLKYTGSALGYVWSLVKPLAYFGVLYVIFVEIFHQQQDDFGLQLLLAVVIFTFFAECTSAGLGSIAGNGHLIRKATFPLSALVIATSVTALFTFLINLVLVLLVALVAGKLRFGWQILAVPPLLIELYVLSLGVGMILASVFVFFRDVGHVWEVISQLLIYACGVVFPAKRVIDAHFVLPLPLSLAQVYFANPLAQNIEDLRHALVTPAAAWSVTITGLGIYMAAFALSAASFGAGLLLFRRLAPYFAESL
jgi:ABC-2 type transport system permease protein